MMIGGYPLCRDCRMALLSTPLPRLKRLGARWLMTLGVSFSYSWIACRSTDAMVTFSLDPDYVIAATHGKRAIDNLRQFKPHLEEHQLPKEVQAFEESILAFADEYQNAQKSRSSSTPSFASASSATISTTSSQSGSIIYSRSSSVYSSDSSVSNGNDVSSHDFGFSRSMFGVTPMARPETITYEELQGDVEEAWGLEEELVDRSVQILPGVRRMIESIPEGRYCVATSGAKTYGECRQFLAAWYCSFILASLYVSSSLSPRCNEPRWYKPSCCYHHR